MATHDYNIANQGFPAFRTDLNNALAAIVSQNSSATAPATTFAHMIWVDTSANPSVIKMRNADNDAWVSMFEVNQTSDLLTKVYGLVIGTDVQAYDAELQAISTLSTNGIIARTSASTAASRSITGTTNVITVTNGDGVSGNPTLTVGSLVARTDQAKTFTTPQRGTVTTDNDGSFDLSVTNNFQCTPSGNFTLTFTNRTAGQSGFILLINTGGHTISAHADTLVQTGALSTISAAGTYLLSYFATSSKVYVTHSGAMA